MATPRRRRPCGRRRRGTSALHAVGPLARGPLLGRDRRVALVAREAVAFGEAVMLGVELVVGQAAFVQPGARLVQLGLRALAGSDLLGLLRARDAVRSAIAVG